jgi:hypothetical protein
MQAAAQLIAETFGADVADAKIDAMILESDEYARGTRTKQSRDGATATRRGPPSDAARHR